jgi:transposase
MQNHISIGIDVSEDTLDIWIHPLNKYNQFNNNQQGIKELISTIQSYNIIKIVVEATGGLEYEVAKSLQQAGYPIAVVNPFFTAAFRTMRGKFTKTDIADAQMLALFAEKLDPQVRPVLNNLEKELKDLIARRNQLNTMVVAERNRLRRTKNNQIVEDINYIITILNRQKQEVEERMLKHIQNIEKYKNIYDLLITVPGIGSITAIALIIELPELGSLNCKQIASLIGVAPHCRESGKTKLKARTQGGRKTIRASLYMAAITAIRCNPAIKPFYTKLVERGKPKKLAITAAMRKIIIILNNIVKNNRVWQNDYKQNYLTS